MPCVWVKAYEGSLAMRGGAAIAEVLPPLDHARKGSSTWLRRGARSGEAEHDAPRPTRTTSATDPSAPLIDLPGIPRAAGSSACCGAANSPSPPN